MTIADAKTRVLEALDGMDVESVDDTTSPRAEGLLLSFEGFSMEGFDPEVYIFGLYVSRKILNKQTQSIYGTIDLIVRKILEHAVALNQEDAIAVKSIVPVAFENGILEYRVEIKVR
jgi:hypothetical protein